MFDSYFNRFGSIDANAYALLFQTVPQFPFKFVNFPQWFDSTKEHLSKVKPQLRKSRSIEGHNGNKTA